MGSFINYKEDCESVILLFLNKTYLLLVLKQ